MLFSSELKPFLNHDPVVFPPQDQYTYVKIPCANQGDNSGPISYEWYTDKLDANYEIQLDTERMFVDVEGVFLKISFGTFHIST